MSIGNVIVISGPVGIGKTSVAEAMSETLTEHLIVNAVIDLDHLRSAYPRPAADPFHMALGYKNLADVWKNFKTAGVTHAMIPNVTEDESNLEEIKKAMPGAEIKIVRLTAPLEVIHERLRKREIGASLEWHLNRAEELSRKLADQKIEDILVEAGNKSPKEIAAEVLSLSGWLTV